MQIQACRHYLGHTGAIYALAPGRQTGTFYSAGGDGWLVEWALNQDDGRLLAHHTEPLISLSVSGDHILAGTMTGKTLIYRQDHAPRLVDWHKKGLFIILVHHSKVYTLGGDGRVTRWSTDFKPEETLHLSAKALRSGLIVDDAWLYIGASDGFIYEVELPGLSLVKQWAAHSSSVFSLAYKEGILYSGGRDAWLKNWDPQAGRNLVQVPAHLFTINALAWAGDYLVSGSRDKTLKIWRVPDLELLKVIDIFKFEAHFRSVNHLLFLAEEQILLSAGDDRQIISWKLE